MKMTFLCEASSLRTGSGDWHQWTASSSEGVWWARPCLWAACGASPGCDRASPLSRHRLSPMLPDSLTTWEIHGMSLSKSTGQVALPGPPVSPHHPPSTQAPSLGPFSYCKEVGAETWMYYMHRAGRLSAGPSRVLGSGGGSPTPPQWDLR